MKLLKQCYLIFMAAVFMIAAFTAPALALPYLTVTQTVPNAFVNDSAGQLYKVTFQNNGDHTAQNVTVDINPPEGGFTFLPGSVEAKKNNGAPLTTSISGTDPAHISFVSQLDLAVGDTLEVTYRLATGISVIGGEQYVLHVTGFYFDGATPLNDQDEVIVAIKQGALEVALTPIDPDPFETYRGNQVTLEAKLTNTGDGALFAIPFHIDWGSGFGSPQLIPGESNVTPDLNGGNQYQITLDQIPAGQSKYFQFQLTVNNYQNFSLDLTANNPAEPGVDYTDSVIFNLLVKQPKITINAPDIVIEYGVTKSVDITITNDNTSGNQGSAREFKLNTTIDPVMTISNLAAGWTYSSGTFTYTAGVIAKGQTIHLTFDIVPKNIAGLHEGVNGYIRITPSYKNDIDQLLSSPIVKPAWSMHNVPTLTVTQTLESQATDGDNYRVFLSEQFTFILAAHLTHTDKWKVGQNIVLTDIIPDDFAVTAATPSVGTVDRTGNNITWTLTYAQAAGTPVLTINATATSNPNRAGNFIGNNPSITGTTIWNCVLTDTDPVQVYLQSRDAGMNYTYETKLITNKPSEGSYDVCGKDGKDIIEYQLHYTFDAGSTGIWTGSWVKDGMERSQIYVDESSEYKIGAGAWTPVPQANITSSPLKYDLGFLKNVIGSDSVAGKDVYFRYRLRLTDPSLAAGNSSVYTFLSQTDLMLAGATGGHITGSEHHFYQGVFVPISRAAMNIWSSFADTVTKGEVVPVTIHVGKLTPWDNKNLKVTIKTKGHYSYIGSPTYNGFGGMTPAINIFPLYPDTVTFTFADPLVVNQGGTITFNMVKTDDADYSLESQLDFDDSLNAHTVHSYTETPDIQLEGSFSVTVNPNPVKVTTHGLTWQIAATNIGNGRTYDAVCSAILKDFMQFVSSTVDGVPVAPGIQDLGNGYQKYTWALGNMDPNDGKVIQITIETDGSSSNFTNASELIAYPTWKDRDLTYHSFNISDIYAPVFTTLISSTFVKNTADNPIELCGSGTIKLYVRNNGNTHNYNIILTDKLLLTNFSYIPGTAKIGGVAINNPQVSGTNLIWTYDSGQPNYLPQLADMAPQSEFTIEFDVQTHEDFNIYQKIQPVATSWQKPFEYGGPNRTGTYTGAEYRVPILQPNIVLTVDGKNTIDSVYTDNVTASIGDTVDWRIQITNSGTAAAKNVTLNNILPATMSFVSINPAPLQTLSAGESWKIADIAKATTATYYVRAVFNGPCGPNATNSSSVTWGLETSSITTPTTNNDTANLITQPQVTGTDINITSFTTKQGHVTVTLVTSGAPLYNLDLTLDITNRFKLDSAIIYSTQLQGYSSEPALNTVGNNLAWSWVGPIRAGTHTIDFDIRDANNSCSNNASITPVINYTYKNSGGANPPSFSGSFNSRTFTPAKTFLSVSVTPEVKIVHADGDTVSWTIQVTNTGTANATDMEIVDVLGDGTLNNGFTYLGTTSPAPTSISNNTLTWSNLSLDVGQTHTITLNARVNTAGVHDTTVTATEYNRDNTATVDSNAKSVSVTMMNFSKTLDQATGAPNDTVADSYGEIAKFTITAEYLDTGDFKNIVINDTLPNGLQYVSGELVSSTKTTVTPNHSGKNLTWNLTDFTGPETVTISYFARIVDEGQARGSNLTNSAKSSFDEYYNNGINATFPNTLAELRDSKSITLKRPDVYLSARSSTPASSSSVYAGQTISHSVTVTNRNLADVSPAYEIKVEETLPVGERVFDPVAGATVSVQKNGSSPLVLNTDYTCVFNAGTGKLTFNFKNTSLGILQKNEYFTIAYQTKIDDTIGAGLTLNHSVQLVNYYSQPVATTGIKSYTGNTLNASYTTQPSGYGLSINSPANGKVKPGDIVSYHLTITVPKGSSVYDATLVDNLPAGLSYVNGSSDGLKKGGVSYWPLTPVASGDPLTGQTLTWGAADNVDITNADVADWQLTIDFNATVLNTAAIQNGNTLIDNYKYNYNKFSDGSGGTNNSWITANLTVSEPQLTVIKTVISSAPYEAGETISYKINVQNNSTETAYDLTVTDILTAKMTLSGVPATTPGSIQFNQTGQTLTWGGDGNLDLAPGNQVDITYNITLNDTVEPREVITAGNAALQWTSQDGTNANERTYALNSTPAPTVTIQDVTAFTKNITGSPTNVIGDTVQYQMVLTLTRGTNDNVVIYDTLPTGMEFVSATITPNSGGGAGTVQFIPNHTPQANDIGTINWNLGTVVVPGNQSNTITIDYVARIMNVVGNQAGQSMTNSAYASYHDAADLSRNTSTQNRNFTVKEPDLVLSKIYPGGTFKTGDTVTCTVKVWHNTILSPHNVDAYNVVVEDNIPTGMNYIPGSSNPPATLNNGKLTWQIDQIDTSHDGSHPVIFTYDVFLDDTVQPGQQITSNVNISWTSLPGNVTGERTGADGMGGLLNDYALVTSASLNSVDMVSFSANLMGSSNRAIGENVSYQLVTRINEGTTGSVVVKNILPVGMKYVSAVILKGNTGISYTILGSPATGDTGELVWNLGTILDLANGNSSDDTITIQFTAVVQDLPGNSSGTVLTNTAHLEYVDGQGDPHTLANQDMTITVIEPQLTINASGPPTIQPGQQADFTVDLQNTGNGTAWQTKFKVALPSEMSHQSPSLQSLKAGTRALSETGPDDYDLTYDSGTGQWAIILKSAAARIDAGETLTLIFKDALNNDEVFTTHQITLVASVAHYYSMDTGSGIAAETHTYAPANVNDSVDLNILTPVIVTACTVSKPLANPGQTEHYTVTITNNGNADVTNAGYLGDNDANFAAGTLQYVSASSGEVTFDAVGGANGTGRIVIDNITIPKAGGTLTVEWDITLKPVLPNGLIIDGEADLTVTGFPAPINIDLTDVTIQSAPVIHVEKVDTDINGGSLTPGDIIRYTITLSNTGNENAKNSNLKDLIPSNTVYVPGTTTLNGVTAPDISGMSPLVTGLSVNTPGEANGWIHAGETATMEFQIHVSPGVVNGTVIANQAELTATGENSGSMKPVLSDDPDTTPTGDATLSVVGLTPVLYAVKNVTDDNGGLVLAGDTLTYHIRAFNHGTATATQMAYKDYIPLHTTFVEGSIKINNVLTGDTVTGGSFTGDLADMAPGAEQDITYKVTVDPGSDGQILTCQGIVSSQELPDVLTDADGNPANGSQPTEIPVGSVAIIRATMSALDTNGGAVLAGDTVEYRIQVINTGNADATNVVISAPIPVANLTYLANTTLVNGVDYPDQSGAAPILEPGINLGTIAVGKTVMILYRVRITDDTPTGTVIDCQTVFTADAGISGISDSNLNDETEQGNNAADPNDDDPTRIQVGGNPGVAKVTGTVYWDKNCNGAYDAGETKEQSWQVEIFHGESLIDSTITDVNGNFQFVGLVPGSGYLIRFKTPVAGVLWKTIENISLLSGTILSGQDLPIHPTGIIYDAVTRQPVPGAKVTITGPAGFDPAAHLPAGQQDQTTSGDGMYRFELLFAAGAPEGIYQVSITPPQTYSPVFPSTILEPEAGVYQPANIGGINKVTASSDPPGQGETAMYYLSFNRTAADLEIVNNHIALDPIMADSIVLTKTASQKSVASGDIVNYTVTLKNKIAAVIIPFTLQDVLPAGFKYLGGSARVDGLKTEPVGDRVLDWRNLALQPLATMTVTYSLIAGTSVLEGKVYTNSATAIHGITGTKISNTGTAKVQIVAEPLLTRALVIGKVFSDKNRNGVQDEGEPGLANIRIITVRGQMITTDAFGRYQLENIDISKTMQGQNIVLKVDPRSIPAGMVFTTENPKSIRLTQGVMAKVNFGVATPTEKTPNITVMKVIPAEGVRNEVLATVIEGTGFATGAKLAFARGTNAITVNDVKVISDTRISCSLNLTNTQVGLYDVKVTNPDGKSGELTDAFTVKAKALPGIMVTKVTPDTGVRNEVAATVIDGKGFLDGADVTFGKGGQTIPVSEVKVTSETQISCTLDLTGIPAGPYDVKVTNDDGRSGALSNAFTVVPNITVTKVNPDTGEKDDVVATVIDGTGFRTGAVVTFAKEGQTIPVSDVKVISDTRISCTLDLTGIPVGPYDVKVANDDGKSGALANAFTVVPKITVTKVTPDLGTINDVVATVIDGTGFRTGATVKFDKGEQTIPVSDVKVISDTQISCKLDLTGIPVGPYDVKVTNDDGRSGGLSDAFQVVPVITVTKVLPEEGMKNEVVPTEIEGTGFRDGAAVTFTKDKNTIVVNEIKVNSAISISCKLNLTGVPEGLYDLKVTNTDGKSGALSDAFKVKLPFTLLANVDIVPLKGFNNGSMLMTLSGPDVTPGMNVMITNQSGAKVTGLIVNRTPQKIDSFFNIKDLPTGKYDIVGVRTNGQTVKLATGFEIRVFSPDIYNTKSLTPIFFDFDKSNVRPDQKLNADKDLEVLMVNPNAGIILGGYTDSRGSIQYNSTLSWKRATEVKNYLIAHGIKPERIAIYAYGKEFAKLGTDENVWQNDRRVDVIMYEEK